MKSVLLRVLILMVTVIFVFGVGCDYFVGPVGPMGPEGPEGPAGDDGLPSSEMHTAIEQALEAYFTALSEFASDQTENDPPTGIEVFGNVFTYPVYADPYGYGLEVFGDEEALGNALDNAYFEQRWNTYPPTMYTMVSYWIGGGPSAGGGNQMYMLSQIDSASVEQWIGVGAIVEIAIDYGEGIDTEIHPVEIAVVVGTGNEVSIKYLPLPTPNMGW